MEIVKVNGLQLGRDREPPGREAAEAAAGQLGGEKPLPLRH